MYLVHSQFHIHVSVLLRLSIDYPWSPPVSTGQPLVRNPGEGPSRYPTKFSKTTWISNLGELSCQLLTTSRVCVALGACGKRKTIINQQNAMLYYRCRESGHHRGKRRPLAKQRENFHIHDHKQHALAYLLRTYIYTSAAHTPQLNQHFAKGAQCRVACTGSPMSRLDNHNCAKPTLLSLATMMQEKAPM